MTPDQETEKVAAALALDNGKSRLLARGRNEVAEEIILVARNNNIPVFENLQLSYQLEQLPLGTEIPEKVFFALTQTMEYIYAFGSGNDGENEQAGVCGATKTVKDS